MKETARHQLLIAGGGVAGLEALLALRALAPEHVDVTLIEPQPYFHVRALDPYDAFGSPPAPRYELAALCRVHGAWLVPGAVTSVAIDPHVVSTGAHGDLAYDSLLVAVGARPEPVFADALTYRGLQDGPRVRALIRDVDAGLVSRVAFVVPTGVAWTLPLYELALLTAARAETLGLSVAVIVVTCEDQPLGMFGLRATADADEVLARAGVVVLPGVNVRDVAAGDVVGTDGAVVTRADRVVALPRLSGAAFAGLPRDPDGFVPVDPHGLVPGAPCVFAAGDATTFAIKQGGIAAQQAHAAAASIAARAGAPVVAHPFRPVLRGALLTSGRLRFLHSAITGGAGEHTSELTDEASWWPPTKVAAPYLMSALERRNPDLRVPPTRL